MRKSIIAGLAMWATFAAFAGKAHADVNYPWCLMGDTRGYECVFSTREQCMQDGRNRGFGSQCIPNPYYKPGAPTVSGQKRTVSRAPRPSQARSAVFSTCTGLKSYCLSLRSMGDPRVRSQIGEAFIEQKRPYYEKYCNFYWEQCMKTGWWEVSGHRAEPR
jgi:hypothetical protein